MTNDDDSAWLLGVHPQCERQLTPEEHVAGAWALYRAGYEGLSRHDTGEDAKATALGLLIALRNGSPDREWMAVWSKEIGQGVDSGMGFLTTSDLSSIG